MTVLLQMISRAVAIMPLKPALRLGRALGWMLGRVVRYRRPEVIAALRSAFPDLAASDVRRIADEMYKQQGMNLIEMLRLSVLGVVDLQGRVVVEGGGHLEGALRGGRGAIILTAHVGNWDMLGVLANQRGYRVTIITKGVKNEALNRFWSTSRERLGLKLVPARESYRACLRALRRNHLVGFILDQNMTEREGVFVDFFGRPACTTPGLAYMSAHSGAPVVPVFSIRRSLSEHMILVLPPIEPVRDKNDENIRNATQRYTSIIEDVIRSHPEQWIWMHRRWRTRPNQNGELEDSRSL